MSRVVMRILLFAVTIVIGTIAGGWWLVPIIAGVGGYWLGRGRAPGRAAALGAILAWGGVLAWYRISGFPIDLLTVRLAGAMQLPPAGLIALAMAFPALLAGAAGALGGLVRGDRSASPGA